jgi:glycosyltransferase involved in cell wall biosynthesis
VNSLLSEVRLFAAWPGNVAELRAQFDSAGFSPALGFEPLRDDRASTLNEHEPPSAGSLLIVDEESFASVHRWIRRSGAAADDLYVLYISDPRHAIARGREERLQLPADYGYVGRVWHDDLRAEELAAVSAGMVTAARSNPDSILLWIVDNDPSRFERGGCWWTLVETLRRQPSRRLLVAASAVLPETLADTVGRRRLVNDWRRHIMLPIKDRGARLVLVADNHFSDRDSHLGESWAASVRDWLPQSQVFVASSVTILPERPDRLTGIWLVDETLHDPERDLIIQAVSHPPSHSSPASSSNLRPRALVLCDEAFDVVWPSLLSQSDRTLMVQLHRRLAGLALPESARSALRQELGALAEFETLMPILSDSLLDLPEAERAVVRDAWRFALTQSHQTATPVSTARRQPLRVLSVATEWMSGRGGLSTLNRELCTELAALGHNVTCLVPHTVGDEEISVATAKNVQILRAPAVYAGEADVGVFLEQPALRSVSPEVIIGHGRVTGQAARQQQHYLHGALRAHFIHMSAEEMAPFKSGGDEFIKAQQRRDLELELASTSQLVVGVGPRLWREVATELRGQMSSTPCYQFNPGLFDDPLAMEASPPPGVFCLIFGRMADAPLKGVDLAAAALGRLSRTAFSRYGQEFTLIVRGAMMGSERDLFDFVQRAAGDHLLIRPRTYSTDPDALLADIRESSLVLMPSRTEGFGLAGLEAIAAGTPLLAASRSGLAELLRESLPADLARHMIVERGEDDDETSSHWADAIDRVFRDRESAFRRAAEVRAQLLDRFAWKKVASAFAERLAQLLAPSR